MRLLLKLVLLFQVTGCVYQIYPPDNPFPVRSLYCPLHKYIVPYTNIELQDAQRLLRYRLPEADSDQLSNMLENGL